MRQRYFLTYLFVYFKCSSLSLSKKSFHFYALYTDEHDNDEVLLNVLRCHLTY